MKKIFYILKNKKVSFGLVGGLLVVGGITTLTVLLINDDEQEKQKIDVSRLTSNSFEASGTQTFGTINLKKSVTLPKEIKLKYFIGSITPNSDKAFKSNKPVWLKNGDIVYIKFYIATKYFATHQLKDKNIAPIRFVVFGLPKTNINNAKLIPSSFQILGKNNRATISQKKGIAFPSEVEARYFVSQNTASKSDVFKAIAPTSLSDGDIVHIRFFIKPKYATTHKFASDFANSISILVQGLKTIIGHRALKASSFEFVNEDSKTIKWKEDETLPEQLIIKYYKSSLNTRPSSDNDYETRRPKNLNEGDNIYIKFFIKEEYENTHKFANEFKNMIHLEVKNNSFKIIIATSNFKKSFFEIIGNEGTATIKLKSKSNLPNEVEVKYAKSNLEPTLDSAYSSIAPINLNNNDIIYIKFFIKNSFTSTHEFPRSGFTNPFPFRVSGLKTLIDDRSLKKSSFEVSGMQGQGTISWKSRGEAPTLPSQIEIRYYKGSVKPINDNSYETTSLLGLSNDDIVHIKFFIKEEYIATHKFASEFANYVLFVVKDLDKNEVEIGNLVASSFEVTGIQGTGQIALKSEIVLPEQVEVKYYKSISPPLSDSNYLVTLHSDLSNGDKVHIKFFIKNNYLTSHKFPDGFDNPIIYTIKNLKTLIDSSKLTSSAFVITTAGNLKTINKNDDVLLPQQVEARYYKSTSNPTKLDKNKKYSTTWPTSFGDGEIVSIRFFIKEEYLATHQFPTNFNNDVTIAFNDVTLKTIINDAKLVKSSFQVRGSENIGILEFKDPASLPNAVEIRYLKQNDASNNDDDYRNALPATLKNGDIVWIKFFIKDDFKTNHQFRAAFN